MRRLLLVPVVVAPVAACAWWSGLAWPVMTQVWSIIAPRPCNEADWIG